MRTRFWALGIGLLLLAGCAAPAPAASGAAVPATPAPDASASDEVEAEPEDYVPDEAAAQGGACHLLAIDLVEQVTGTRFDVAAASQQEKTYTCLLRQQEGEFPELVLSVTETTVDAAIFKEEVAPRGAKSLTGLGKAAYRARLAESGGQPPAVEVGWLSGDQRLISLRYTPAEGEDPAELEPKLVALAERIDVSRV